MSPHTIEGEARLDNREALLRALQVTVPERGQPADLAVILAAYERWGADCPEKLLGDFAFVIRDPRTGYAFGARDHLGVKPFYYRATDRGLGFATRASAIPDSDGLPLTLDDARVADACVPALECIDKTSTFYRGVFRLPAGCCVRFDNGRGVTIPYWTPDASREIRLSSDAEYVEAFREIFSEAVRCRLSGSAASMLSGGVDSSAVVGFARTILQADRRPALTTLSCVTDDPDCEESRHIRAVWELPGLDPVAIRPLDVGRYRDELVGFIDSMEEPFDDSMILPLLLYAAARRRGFGAVLDGVDGDTVASHEPDILAAWLRAGRFGLAFRQARGFARFHEGTYGPFSSTARLLAVNAGRAFAPPWVRAAVQPLRRRFGVRAALGASFVSGECAQRTGLPSRLLTLWSHRELNSTLSPRERQAREIAHPQLGAALERYHRVAASQGIEARHPFLDKRVVEFCLALPWHQKVSGGWSKRIVRESAAGYLPDPVRWRRGRWVRLGAGFLNAVISDSRDFLAAELSGNMSELAPYLDVSNVRACHERYRHGDTEAGAPVWSAAVLSFWLRKVRSRRYDSTVRANGPAAPLFRPSRDDGVAQEDRRNGFSPQNRDDAPEKALQKA